MSFETSDPTIRERAKWSGLRLKTASRREVPIYSGHEGRMQANSPVGAPLSSMTPSQIALSSSQPALKVLHLRHLAHLRVLLGASDVSGPTTLAVLEGTMRALEHGEDGVFAVGTR